MKETDWRKWHRNLGIVLALFVALQAASGLLLSLEGVAPSNGQAETRSGGKADSGQGKGGRDDGEGAWEDILGFVHTGGGSVGALYRVLLGLGVLGMAASGTMICLKIRGRSAKRA